MDGAEALEDGGIRETRKEGLRGRKTPTIWPSVLQRSTKAYSEGPVCVCFINAWVCISESFLSVGVISA